MKKIFLACLVFMIVAACDTKLEEVVEETYPDGSAKVVRYYATKDGERVLGKELSYYPNGNKRLEGEYLNDMRHGKWSYWYVNGNLWSEGYFAEGKRTGPGTTYHENGRKYMVGNYENGVRSGKWSFWDKEGNLIKKIDYSEK